jgi:hypothetical protein
MDEYFCERDMVDSEFIYLETLDEVEELLAKWGIDSAVFDAPWKCDYPM